MKKLYLPLILFVFLVFEGLAINLLPTEIALSENLFIAHWVLALLVYIAVYYDSRTTYYSIIYAFIFGLLVDIIYTGVLGVYMFSYGLVIYIIHNLQKLLQRNFFVLILLGIFSFLMADSFIYLIYYVVGITEMVWQDYLVRRLLPTIVANLVFFIILFPIFKKRIGRWGNEQLNKED